LPEPHYKVVNGQCRPSCGALGGTNSGNECNQANMVYLGQSYDAGACCKYQPPGSPPAPPPPPPPPPSPGPSGSSCSNQASGSEYYTTSPNKPICGEFPCCVSEGNGCYRCDD
jgi:hypothetical protein